MTTHKQGEGVGEGIGASPSGRAATPSEPSPTVSGIAGIPDAASDYELLRWAKLDFANALKAMPFGADRLENGQQFNAYESAENDDFASPDDWEYFLSLGPITDCAHILDIEGEWRAKLIEAALRVALRIHRAEPARGEA